MTGQKIWQQPNFVFLWVGSSVSSLADSAYYVILAWFVLTITHSDADLATALLLASLPRLLFMMIGGVAVDRLNPRILMIASLTARGMILLGLAGVLVSSHIVLHAFLLYTVATLFGIVDAFYWPTQNALVPDVIATERLAVANSFIQTAQQTSMVLGPLLAGILLQIHTFWLIFTIVGAIYLASLCAIVMLRPHEAARGPHTATSGNVWRELQEGIQYVLGIRIILFLMMASMVINLFFMGPVNIGLPAFVQQHHWSGTVYGYFESAVGLGAVGGGLFTVVMKGLRGHFRWIALSASMIGMGLAAAALMPTWEWGVACMAIAGAAMSITNIPMITFVQTIVDPGMMGRVMGLLTLMSVGLTPVSYGLSAVIMRSHWLSPPHLMIAGGVIIALFCAGLIFQPDFRRMESHPLWLKSARASSPES